jgi:hypothetical protein
MIKLFFILFAVLCVLLTSFSFIAKYLLYRKGYKTTILNKDFSDLKYMKDLARKEPRYKPLFILGIIFIILPILYILFFIIYFLVKQP